jgi:hypothetical protein
MSPLFVVCQWPCVNNVHSAVIIQNINNLDEPPAGRRADNPQFLVSPRASGYGGCAFSTTACASLAGTPCLVACSAFQSFQRKAADHHVPILIYPNPLYPQHYVVLNSGFTYREYDYLNNARQSPKLPDYAIVDVNVPRTSQSPGGVVAAGFFGEQWELLQDDGKSAVGWPER